MLTGTALAVLSDRPGTSAAVIGAVKVGPAVSALATPIPESARRWARGTEPPRSSVTTSSAPRGPAAVGENATAVVHDHPAGRLDLHAVPSIVKSAAPAPETAMPPIVSGASPVLASVAFCDTLWPTVTVPNARPALGARSTTGRGAGNGVPTA